MRLEVPGNPLVINLFLVRCAFICPGERAPKAEHIQHAKRTRQQPRAHLAAVAGVHQFAAQLMSRTAAFHDLQFNVMSFLSHHSRTFLIPW
ncbi:MAG: hypothetical protein ACXAEL_01610 [Candidatus Hodarchaeales archaeon]